MDKKLNFQEHIKYTRSKALQRIRQLHPVTNTQVLNIKQKTTLYISLIRSKLLYASPTWGHTTHAHIQTLQIVQNRFTRAITGCDRFTPVTQLHECLALQYIKDLIQENAKKLKDKYTTHTQTP